jgi:hypothetical protein
MLLRKEAAPTNKNTKIILVIGLHLLRYNCYVTCYVAIAKRLVARKVRDLQATTRVARDKSCDKSRATRQVTRLYA